MRMTLLEMTQDILSDMDSDEVNSIDDTVEAGQVAQIIRTCYFEMIGNRNWPHLRKLLQLEASNELAKPNYLILPARLKELVSIRYDVSKFASTDVDVKEIKFKDSEDFLRSISHRKSSNANITSVTDYSGINLLIANDVGPTYWTSFDDKHIVCDSYDKTVDDTLKKSKTECIAFITPTWERSNDSVPDLPIEAFPALLEEARSTAFFALKQMANSKAEQKATRQQRWLSRKAWSAEGSIRFPNYGRK